MSSKDLIAHARPSVLVVDDQPASLRGLCDALAGDCDLRVTRSAEEALRLCQSEPPDLVLMDVVMPGMDGLSCCRALAADPATRDVPVIFVTASGSPEDELACWEAGAVDFISKPATAMTVRKRVGAHLRLKRMADQLRLLSITDELTGLPNRRAFDQAFKVAWANSARSGAPIGLLLVDVDWFKAYNDTYGHAAGDQALQAAAGALRACVRGADDLIARIGGEEFAVLLPEGGARAVQAFSQRLLAAFEQLALPHEGSPLGRLTASMGGLADVAGPGRDKGWFMGKADQNLYHAKKAGRARLHWSTEEERG